MFEIVFHDKKVDVKLFVNQFLKSLDASIESRYVRARQLRVFILWLDRENIDMPARSEILRFRDYLQHAKKLSSFTVGSYLTVLRRYFEFLESEQLYPNITKNIKGPKRNRNFHRDALSVEQATALLNSIDQSTIDGLRDFAMINLMIRSALRTCEISRARVENLRPKEGVTVLFVWGKGRPGYDEFVLVTSKSLDPLKRYLSTRSITDTDPLFASHSTKNFGKQLTTRSISRIVKERLKAIGICNRRLSAHSLRHTSVTFSLMGGASLMSASKMARHASIETTMIYAHSLQRIKEAAEYNVDKILDQESFSKTRKK